MSKRPKRWRRILLFVTVLPASILAIFASLAPHISVDTFPEIQFLAIGFPFTLPLWAFWAWRGWKLRARWSMILSILVLLVCGRVVLRDWEMNAEAVTPESTLSVLSFNVGTFNFDPENIFLVAELLDSLKPDVVVMQEFRNQRMEDGKTAMEYLQSRCGFEHNQFVHLPYHVHGAAIFSHHQITGLDTLFLPVEEINSGILFRLETDLGPAAVANVHLTSFHMAATMAGKGGIRQKFQTIHRRTREALHLQQAKIDAIVAGVSDLEIPVIVAGDFNCAPHSRIIEQMRQILSDSFSEAGSGNGWTYQLSRISGIRIDYQFASSNLQPLSHEVIRVSISDHYPTFVTYQTIP